MNIVVCIKQVPDVDDIKWTKENNLDRAGMLSKINPHDEYALDWAMTIKNKFKDVTVTAISMGPNQAKEVLNLALAKGANRAILLLDKLFVGSDTIVTAKILAKAIKKYVPDFSLIITGQLACDGDTAQVPVGLAEMLAIPDVIGADELINADKNLAIAAQIDGDNKNIIELSIPCLIAVNNKPKDTVIPKIDDYIEAQTRGIEVYGSEDLGFEKNEVGVLGSPTLVWRAFRPEYLKDTKEIKEEYSKNILEIINRVSK